MFAFSRVVAQNTVILVQPVLNLQKSWSESVFWKKSSICGGSCNLAHKTLKFKGCVFVNFCFFSVFGTKRKHTGLTSSESAKELVRIGVLKEKLYF